MKIHVLHELLLLIALCLAMSGAQQNKVHQRANAPARRHRRSPNNDNSLQDLLNVFPGQDQMANTAAFLHYTPSTPAPNDINCYVEVPTTQRRGGRCIQLGIGGLGRRSRNRPWACQAGVHLAFSADCPANRRRGGQG